MFNKICKSNINININIVSTAIITFLILLLFNGRLISQQGWQYQNVTFNGISIYFKDINTGIISAFKTNNAGVNWSQMDFGGYNSFPDQNTGYSTGGGLLFKTTNFGNNWVMQNNPTNQSLFSIHFINVNTGYSCGEFGNLIRSSNGGDNWFAIEPIIYPLRLSYIFTNVMFTDQLTGFITGHKLANDTSVFIKTTNGGVNWTVQRYTVSNWGKFTSMFFVNSTTGYIGASSNSSILKTTNGGISWFPYTIPTSNRIYSIHFPSGNIGYASCFGGQILKTTDGGSNWFLQTTGTGSPLHSVFFLNDLTGYAAGENTVLKTTDGGGAPIGITPISNEVPVDFRLEQNYPNPFNPTTNINFSIPKAAYTSIRIYDIMGRHVHTLFETQLAPGSYKADWNASQMPSGIYIYRIESGSFTHSRKMIMIK